MGMIHFLTKDRMQFVQTCRFCKGMRTGRFKLTESGAPEVIYDRFAYHGLENSSSKSSDPREVNADNGERDE